MVPWSHLRQPFSGWVMTVLTAELTHFNLVIHLSKAKQSAFLFCTIFWVSRCSCGPSWNLWNPSLLSEATSNYHKPPFLQQPLQLQYNMFWDRHQADSWPLGVVFCLLMVVWWGWTFCASNSLELDSRFMPLWLTGTRAWIGATHDL